MKNLFIRRLALCLLGAAPFSAAAQNPISPPGIYIADPSARVGADGRLYIYGSLDESIDYYCSQRYHVLSTDDMKNWTLHENSFASAGPDDRVAYSDQRLYAPDCIHRDGAYYLYYCLSGRGVNEGVATGDRPEGPFRSGKPFEGISGIDPTVLIDDDGQAYLFYGQNRLKAVKLHPDMQSIDPATHAEGVLTKEEHFFHEGCWAIKRGGIYYLVYTSHSPIRTATTMAYSTASSPLGPYTYRGIILDNAGCDPATWNNHGSIQEYRGQWYIFYHRSTHGSRMMRKACVEPITFGEDGTIAPVEMTTQGAAGPLDPFTTIDAARACLMTGKTRIIRSAPRNEVLAYIENGGTALYRYFRFERPPSRLACRVRAQAGGYIDLFTDPGMTRVHATIEIPGGDRNTYAEYTAEVSSLTPGVHPIYLRFRGPEGKELFIVDSFRFE